jgi:hypothetical protein
MGGWQGGAVQKSEMEASGDGLFVGVWGIFSDKVGQAAGVGKGDGRGGGD